MAHYFKYKSVADLETENARLGLSLHYTDDFAPLFRPVPVGPYSAGYPLLDDDYLKRLVDHYVAAAKLAQRAGYQFIDLKQCHRYLLSEMLGARSRPGPFGGSYENRTRLARDIITAIRTAVPGLPV